MTALINLGRLLLNITIDKKANTSLLIKTPWIPKEIDIHQLSIENERWQSGEISG
jgi:hypothetical protein